MDLDLLTLQRVALALSVLLLALAAVRLSVLAPLRPRYYLWAGILGIAAAAAQLGVVHYGSHSVWQDIARVLASLSLLATAAGVWRTGSLGKTFLGLGDTPPPDPATVEAELKRLRHEYLDEAD